MLTGLVIGVAAGFVVSWARLSDPAVIRDMLLLRDPHVFLVMGSAVAVAAAGVRVLRTARVRAFVTSAAACSLRSVGASQARVRDRSPQWWAKANSEA